jgi:hypothetical protein
LVTEVPVVVRFLLVVELVHWEMKDFAQLEESEIVGLDLV